MSNTGIDPLKPNHLPQQDATGALTNSPVQSSSSSFFSLTSDYPGTLITAIRLTGLTPENSNGGKLYAETDLYDSTLVIRKLPSSNEYWSSQEDLAVADIYSLGGGGGDLILEPTEHHPGVGGTVSLSSTEYQVSMELFIPPSSVEALVAEDNQYNVSALTLRGVTALNSQNGVLEWEVYEESTVTYFVVRKPGESDLARASVPANTYFPITLELEEVDHSGVTGAITLEGDENSTGHLVIRINDQVHIASDVVIPSFTGSSARPLYVDEHGKIFAYTP